MTMRELPIRFNAEMVRAILGGIKTQTRRPDKHGISPFGKPGDRLWVRETFCKVPDFYGVDNRSWVDYRATSSTGSDRPGDRGVEYVQRLKWTPSSGMPRDASRINLMVKRVWTERLQEITIESVLAEGVNGNVCTSDDDHCDGTVSEVIGKRFKILWNSIYESRGFGFSSNPVVWCCEFEVLGKDNKETADGPGEGRTAELGLPTGSDLATVGLVDAIITYAMFNGWTETEGFPGEVALYVRDGLQLKIPLDMKFGDFHQRISEALTKLLTVRDCAHCNECGLCQKCLFHHLGEHGKDDR